MHVSLWRRTHARNHKESNSDACDDIPYVLYVVMRGNLKIETPAVFCATWMRVTLTESWNTREHPEHPWCDKIRDGKKTREGRTEKRGIFWSLLLFLLRVSSVARGVFCGSSAFSERHAHSRCTEDRRFFEFLITTHCKFNIKHHIKHREDYHRRQSWTPGDETLYFTIRICSTSTVLYFDLYLPTQKTFIYNYVYFITTTWIEKEQNIIQ